MAEFEERITPKELVCELTLDGQLAGHYSIRENIIVLRDGEQFSMQDRQRLLSDAEGAAIVGGDTAAAMAQVQAAQSQIAALQDQIVALNEAADAVKVERATERAKAKEALDAANSVIADLRGKISAAIAAAQPLVEALRP